MVLGGRGSRRGVDALVVVVGVVGGGRGVAAVLGGGDGAGVVMVRVLLLLFW